MDNKIKSNISLYIADNTEDESLVNYFNASDKFTVLGTSALADKVVSDVERLKPNFLIMEVLLSGMDGFFVF